MLAAIDCKHCFGLGRIHSPLKNGDPDDDGLKCESCDGAGVIDVDLDDFSDDEDE